MRKHIRDFTGKVNFGKKKTEYANVPTKNKSLKSLYMIAVAVAFCVVAYQGYEIIMKMKSSSASGVIDWGVSFQTEGETPVGNAENSYLLKYGACFHGDESAKCVYLTFDAGYENGYTQTMLDILKANEVPAAFFLTGNYVKEQGELIKQMNQQGHTVANHTMSHPDMTRLTDDEFAKQLNGVAELYKEHTSEQMPAYFRPPAGKFDETTLQRAKDMGYKTILWSVAYGDWDNNAQPSEASALETLCSRTHNGAIILLHATSKTNSLILDEYIKTLKAQGYEFLPITALEWKQAQ